MKAFLEEKTVENKFYKTKETIAEKFDLPRDIMFNLPKITIVSDNEITIENHKGVVLFEDKEVKINSSVGLISISGRDFEILFMGGSTLTLSGKFKSVLYEGNE